MPEKDKSQFILRKSNLSVGELAAQTGLSEGEVREILQKAGEKETVPDPTPAILKGGWPPSWLCAFFLILAVILVYLPVFRNDFVNWDDKDVLLDNPQIRNLNISTLWWMFTTYANGNWMPLTWLSFAIDYRVNGLDPRVFHGTNVFLHALNTLLVFLVCSRLLKTAPSGEAPGISRSTGVYAIPISFLTALIFGLHPIHVESVAWATERKDVLYSFFYLAGLFLYLGYAVHPQKGKLWACFLLYSLSLTAKPMAVTLPFIFLLLDIWPLGRLRLGYRALLVEKAPFFILVFLSTGVTMASHAHTLSYAQSGVEIYWVLNAFRSLVFYLLKMAFPSGLSAYYPFPPDITGFYLFQNLCAVTLVVGASVYFYRLRRKAPYFLTGWVYYLITLMPVLGFIQTGAQAAADRYTYLPSLGFFLILSAGAARWVSYNRFFFGTLTLVAAGVLGFFTVGQIGTWRNTQVLWERVTRIYPDENADAYSRLGAAYIKAHRYDEALAAFSRASAIPPPMARTFHGLGTVLVYKDRIPEAIQAFEYALNLDPKLTAPRLNLWNVYERLGKHEEAIQQMEEALKVEPASPVFYNDLGVSYGFLKRYGEAVTAFGKAQHLAPDNSEYLVNLATIYQWEGHAEEALEWYRKGITRQPGEPIYYLKMGDIYLIQGKKTKALGALQKAWMLHPANPKEVQQIGEDFEKLGKNDLAQECFTEAHQLAAEKKTNLSSGLEVGFKP